MNAIDLAEAAGRIDDKFILEAASAMYAPKKAPVRSVRRFVLFAAAMILMLSIGTAAYTAGIFGLSGLQADRKDGPAIVISAGKNLAAAGEWINWLENNKTGNRLEPETPDNIYSCYSAFTPEAKSALDSIVQHYGLRLFTDRSQADGAEQLYRLLHSEGFLPAGSGIGTGAVFDMKSVYSFASDAVLPSGKTVYYDFYLMEDGCFMPAAVMLTDPGLYEETICPVSGTDVTLSLGTDRSYLLADTDGYSLAFYIRAGSENKNEALSSINSDVIDMEDLKLFADAIDFTAISQIFR